MGTLDSSNDHIAGYWVTCQNGCEFNHWVPCGPPAASRAGKAVAMRYHLVETRHCPKCGKAFEHSDLDFYWADERGRLPAGVPGARR